MLLCFFVEVNTTEIRNFVNIGKQEVKEEVQDIKKIYGFQNKKFKRKTFFKNPNKPNKEESDIYSIINSAKNIDELYVFLTEHRTIAKTV